jgi:hypothetical protein
MEKKSLLEVWQRRRDMLRTDRGKTFINGTGIAENLSCTFTG